MRRHRLPKLYAATILFPLAAIACGPGSTNNDAGSDAGGGGTFTCGTNTCTAATQYCEHVTSFASGNQTNTYTCKALPTGCSGDFCATCLSGMTGATGCAMANVGDGPSYTVDLTR